MEYEYKQFLQSLGRRLKNVRIESKERQVDLGARIGVSRQTIMRMERGKTGVPLDVWLAASAALGLLETWTEVLKAPRDPFREYDEKFRSGLKKTRIKVGSSPGPKKAALRHLGE